MDANEALLTLAIVLSILGVVWLAVIVNARKRLDITQRPPDHQPDSADYKRGV